MNEHLGGAYACGDSNTFMPDVWGYLMLRYRIESVLDVGCGYGHSMKWFSDMRLAVTGVEGWRDALDGHLLPGMTIAHDYTLGPAPLANATFDMGWSAEFLEHVDEQFIPHYMQDFKRCRLIVVTHAEPGQNGHHHVTLHDDKWWVDMFARHGFQFDPCESALLRLTDRWKSGWGRRTLMVFHRLPITPLPPVEFVPLIPIYNT